jgi:hypothetical protein
MLLRPDSNSILIAGVRVGATVVTDYGGSSGNKGEIWLDNVQCTGNEARLVDCLSNGYATHNCVHTQE